MTTPPEPAPDVADAAAPPVDPVVARVDEWVEVLNDSDALTTRQDLFAAAFESLSATIAMDPRAADVVTDIVDRSLAHVPLTQQLMVAIAALQGYLGVDGTYLLQWIAYEESAIRLGRVGTDAPPAVAHFVRTTMARHGVLFDRLQRVTVVGAGEEWETIEKTSPVDMLSGTRTVLIRLTKLDGTTARFACTNNSLLILTAHLLELVNAPQTMTGYDPSTLATFVDTLATTIDLLNPEPEGASDEQPDPAPDPAPQP